MRILGDVLNVSGALLPLLHKESPPAWTNELLTRLTVGFVCLAAVSTAWYFSNILLGILSVVMEVK